jgi:hypothetical protein
VQLYCLAIEPMLCFLGVRLTGFSVPGVMKGPMIALSAYADDVTVLFRRGPLHGYQGGFSGAEMG